MLNGKLNLLAIKFAFCLKIVGGGNLLCKYFKYNIFALLKIFSNNKFKKYMLVIFKIKSKWRYLLVFVNKIKLYVYVTFSDLLQKIYVQII